MNCSFKCLCNSLYLHSAAIIHNLPIHLQYCNEMKVSLCCGLNLIFKFSNGPSTAQHDSWSSCVSVSIHFRSCLFSHFLYIGYYVYIVCIMCLKYVIYPQSEVSELCVFVCGTPVKVRLLQCRSTSLGLHAY